MHTPPTNAMTYAFAHNALVRGARLTRARLFLAGGAGKRSSVCPALTTISLDSSHTYDDRFWSCFA